MTCPNAINPPVALGDDFCFTDATEWNLLVAAIVNNMNCCFWEMQNSDTINQGASVWVTTTGAAVATAAAANGDYTEPIGISVGSGYIVTYDQGARILTTGTIAAGSRVSWSAVDGAFTADAAGDWVLLEVATGTDCHQAVRVIESAATVTNPEVYEHNDQGTDPADPDDPTSAAVAYNTTTGRLEKIWNIATQSWDCNRSTILTIHNTFMGPVVADDQVGGYTEVVMVGSFTIANNSNCTHQAWLNVNHHAGLTVGSGTVVTLETFVVDGGAGSSAAVRYARQHWTWGLNGTLQGVVGDNATMDFQIEQPVIIADIPAGGATFDIWYTFTVIENAGNGYTYGNPLWSTNSVRFL